MIGVYVPDYTCVLECERQSIPRLGTGSFVISSIGLLEYGGRRFEGVLDRFGKVHSFKLDGGQVCATFRLMRADFLNQSVAAGTIGPGLLFYEIVPLRECPLLQPLCNVQAPNDNAFVLTFDDKQTGELYSTTDSTILTVLDSESLNVTKTITIGSEAMRHGEIDFLASAHPLPHPVTGG